MQNSPASGPVQQLRKSVDKMKVSNSSSGTPSTHGTSTTSGTPSAQPKSQAPPTPKLAYSREQMLGMLDEYEKSKQREIGLVVVGHVDAGKSTLMGRMLVELGNVSDREHNQNVRNSSKAGMGAFAYAWSLDSSEEERARGVTIDVAHDTFRTEHTLFHLLDAPGHKDFVPNMISGAAQADAAVLVIDAVTGAFESGFSPMGQTREHATLLRSLGVQQLIVAVNKLDAADYSQARYDEILSQLLPFLSQCGFDSASIQTVPCAAMAGENLRTLSPGCKLAEWYKGGTLADALDRLKQPQRQYDAPLRMPVNNVFKGGSLISSGLGVSGRIVSGFVQVGEVVRALPGDGWGIVKTIECENDTKPWAAAGAIVTLYLTQLDANQVNIGSVMCPTTAPVPLYNELTVQMLVFAPTYPILPGTAVEVYHHSAEIPAQFIELLSTIDRNTGDVLRLNPRVLTRNSAAMVRVALNHRRKGSDGFPIEVFRVNKDMARVLFRMNGETVAAGIVMEAS